MYVNRVLPWSEFIARSSSVLDLVVYLDFQDPDDCGTFNRTVELAGHQFRAKVRSLECSVNLRTHVLCCDV